MQIRYWERAIMGCVMALLPLITWIIVHSMAGRPAIRVEATRELIFFGLSIFGTGGLALIETVDRPSSPLWAFGGFVCALLAAVSYGAFLTGEALHAAALIRTAYYYSIGIAVAAAIYSASLHYFTQGSSSHAVR